MLPFRNDSAEKDTEHFSNGVMESILNHLAKISQLRVFETKTGGHVWSEAYEYEYKSQFEIMRSIAQEVAKKIRVSITPQEEKLIDQVPTTIS